MSNEELYVLRVNELIQFSHDLPLKNFVKAPVKTITDRRDDFFFCENHQKCGKTNPQMTV